MKNSDKNKINLKRVNIFPNTLNYDQKLTIRIYKSNAHDLKIFYCYLVDNKVIQQEHQL